MDSDRLLVLSGPLKGHEFPVRGQVTIGRSPENILQLNDMQVSRQHAIIQQTQAGTLVRDMSSGNGTFIGEQRILEYRLKDGDTIVIGPFELRFIAGPAQPRPPAQPVGGTVLFDAQAQADQQLQATAAHEVRQTFFQAPQEAAGAAQLKAAQERLAAVYQANEIISSERDLLKLFERVLDQVFALLPAHNGVILLKEEASSELITEYVKSRGDQSEVHLSSTIVNRAFQNAEAVITSNAAADARFGAGQSIIAQNITSAMCAPLIHQGETLGVLYLDARGATSAFDQGDLALLVALSGPSATAIKNAQYLAALEKSYHDTLIVLANAIEMRDHYTVGHTWRVTNFALEAAKVLGWPDEKLKECEMGGVLHDVGKISIDDAILRKPERLTDEEFAMMKVHPERGAQMMRDVERLLPLIPYALYHHERYDGRGYPYGLKGDEIPIEGRLIAVADTFDAMTSNRPYRKGLDTEYAINEMIKGKGTQFDPLMVDAFVQAFREGRISRILQDYNKGAQSVSCPFCSTHIPIPEPAKPGAVFQCTVCHRNVQLQFKNDTYYAERIAHAAANSDALPTPVPPAADDTTRAATPASGSVKAIEPPAQAASATVNPGDTPPPP
jgi:HD-GYP domain-containing protein (c-di-GMP phosphodiesterase class II)